MKWIQQLANQKVRQRIRYFYFIVLLLLGIAMMGSDVNVKEGKNYTDFDHVALYILEYNDVPNNYVTGYMLLTPYRYGPFLNVEEKLPLGVTYTEVYINATLDDLGAERFVFSDDTLYFTNNNYDSFSEITISKILAGYYLFQTIFYTFLFGGVLFLSLMLILSKEVTVDDLKKDILLDYNLLKEKFLYLRDKLKMHHSKWKYKRKSTKNMEE
jgi:hypothetical protein